jgi:hypothetical protein
MKNAFNELVTRLEMIAYSLENPIYNPLEIGQKHHWAKDEQLKSYSDTCRYLRRDVNDCIELLRILIEEVSNQKKSLLEALEEVNQRIKDFPTYQDLETEEREDEVGGDTAELSYLARITDKVIVKAKGEINGNP